MVKMCKTCQKRHRKNKARHHIHAHRITRAKYEREVNYPWHTGMAYIFWSDDQKGTVPRTLLAKESRRYWLELMKQERLTKPPGCILPLP